MKKFSELGVTTTDDRKMFNCPQVSISDILNCEIEIMDFIPEMKTKHGDGRTLIQYRLNNAEGKFFSNSKIIKNTLDSVPKEDFPFLTIIKSTQIGTNKIYKFT